MSHKAVLSITPTQNKITLLILSLLLPAIISFLISANGSAGSVAAQAVAINTTGSPANPSALLDIDAANKGLLVPRVNLASATDVTTVASPAVSLLLYNKATSGTPPNNVVPGYYYWNGTRWTPFIAQTTGAKSTIAFSTGIILSGATVVSAAPVLMGFGAHTTQVINGSGESTSPPEAGGFAFTVPFSGTISNLQISADLLVASVSAINVVGLQYDFTVFVSPSVPNNGIDHLASPYTTTALTSAVRFGFPNSVINAGTFRSASNLNTGSITVNAGDRIGIRIRTLQSTDPSASDITQLSFNASVTYASSQ